jgi:hypothetical protein
MHASATKKTAYALGKVCFSVHNCDAEFEQDLDILLPHAIDQNLNEEDVLEIRTGCEKDVRGLVNHILKRYHSGCLWIDAACLISPAGKRVLIAGRSSTGKSTTTMALALGYGWKVLAEDLVLIDLKTDKVLKFASPFSLKTGTKELLEKTVGRSPQPVLRSEWAPLNELAATENDCPANFDLALYFTQIFQGPELLTVSDMAPTEYLRKVLDCSNILRIPDSATKFVEYISNGQCLMLDGGSLEAKINAIREVCN